MDPCDVNADCVRGGLLSPNFTCMSGVSPGLTSDFFTVIGGSTLPDGDDESSSVTLSPSFPFFGNADSNVYVSLLH